MESSRNKTWLRPLLPALIIQGSIIPLKSRRAVTADDLGLHVEEMALDPVIEKSLQVPRGEFG